MDQIELYKAQIKSVEEALIVATGSQRSDLLDLKGKLEEVVSLLDGNAKEETNSIDDEFAKFQMEIAKIEDGKAEEVLSDSCSSSDSEETNEYHSELSDAISSLEGTKCRAPFIQEWGELGYHNALIVSAEYDPSIVKTMEDVKVKVMFTNPMYEKMKPCPFFLDGHCKFSDDKCKFSHGYDVSFPDIQEFVLPDLGNLKTDSKCLCKSSNGMWSIAVIQKCLEKNTYAVKYGNSRKVETVEADSILPLEDGSSDSDTDEEYQEPKELEAVEDVSIDRIDDSWETFLPFPPAECIEWERHTKGIGSKLMEKMGHVWGQGLGKNSDGRLEPIDAVILPSGKSLDKCIEMRENASQRGPVSVSTRLKVAQDKAEDKAKKINVHSQPRKKSVFDFINDKIATVKGQAFDVKKDTIKRRKDKSEKDLHVEVFTVGEDIKKAKTELKRLERSLQRNIERNSSMKSQVEKKIASQTAILKKLEAKEQSLNHGIKTQTGHRKLVMF